MYVSRRILSMMPVFSATSLLPCEAKAEQAANFDPVKEWGFQPIVPPDQSSSAAPTGTKPPRFGEISKAFRILYESPRDKTPIEVAEYFLNIKEKNQDGQNFNYEWPKDGRANPLIVGFFSSTFTIPTEGDQTSWCAAFVNFCLLASNLPTSNSAQSGSFRNDPNYPNTDSPSRGDIVVFRARGIRGDQGFGHVGFYLDDDGQTIGVLGGNQVGQTHSTGAVTTTRLAYKSQSLELYGFRKIG